MTARMPLWLARWIAVRFADRKLQMKQCWFHRWTPWREAGRMIIGYIRLERTCKKCGAAQKRWNV